MTKTARFGTDAERTGPNAAKIADARRLVYRYALFLHELRGFAGYSGCSEVPGNDFAITLPSWLTALNGGQATESNGNFDQQAATFMLRVRAHAELSPRRRRRRQLQAELHQHHELHVHVHDGAWVSGRKLDYSRKALLTLDKLDLDENVGIGGSTGDLTAHGPAADTQTTVNASGAIDWSGNGSTTDTHVSIPNLNQLGWEYRDMNNILRLFVLPGCAGGVPNILTPFNNWQNIGYNFRPTTNFADGVHGAPPQEITGDELIHAVPDNDGDGVPNLIDNCPHRSQYRSDRSQWQRHRRSLRGGAGQV